MRTVPVLTFRLDESMEYGSKMDELFKKYTRTNLLRRLCTAERVNNPKPRNRTEMKIRIDMTDIYVFYE